MENWSINFTKLNYLKLNIKVEENRCGVLPGDKKDFKMTFFMQKVPLCANFNKLLWNVQKVDSYSTVGCIRKRENLWI